MKKKKDSYATEFARMGAKARWAKTTKEERSEHGRRMNAIRYGKIKSPKK